MFASANGVTRAGRPAQKLESLGASASGSEILAIIYHSAHHRKPSCCLSFLSSLSGASYAMSASVASCGKRELPTQCIRDRSAMRRDTMPLARFLGQQMPQGRSTYLFHRCPYSSSRSAANPPHFKRKKKTDFGPSISRRSGCLAILGTEHFRPWSPIASSHACFFKLLKDYLFRSLRWTAAAAPNVYNASGDEFPRYWLPASVAARTADATLSNMTATLRIA